MHGFGVQISFKSDFGKINLIADNLINRGNLTAAIIIMSNCDPLERYYYKFFSSQMDRKNMKILKSDFSNDWIPFLRSKLCYIDAKKPWVIAGSSIGDTKQHILPLII